MQSFEERSVRSWSEESNGTKLGAKKSHFLRSRSLPRPALLSCPLVPFDAWLSATRCARSRARHTPSPRRPRTPQRTSRRNAAVPTMPLWAGASVESCGFVARRSPGRRLGSVLDVGNRLHRMRGRFHRWIHISTGPQPAIGEEHKSGKFCFQSSLKGSKRGRMRRRRLSDLRPIPEGVRGPICIRKSK